MKQSEILITFLALMLSFSLLQTGCSKKDDNTLPEQEQPVDPFDLLIYENTSRNYKTDQLQASIKKSDLQFSTFGDMESGQVLGAFNKAYVFSQAENTESFILFDDAGEPAFIYKVNLVTGEKKETIVELEKSEAGGFFMRIMYYDWINRLGSLLFETQITKSGDTYTSTPIFVNETFNPESQNMTKTNRSFPIPVDRFEKLMTQNEHQTLKDVQFGFEGWKASWNNLRNSEIADWLVKTRKAGAVLTLAGLGLSETIVGAPAGVWLVAGGVGLVTVSTALEVELTDKWSNFLNETQTKIDALSTSATEIAGNSVQKFQGYAHNLKEHWLNPNINKTTLEELTTFIEEEEIIVQKDNLDDLPDSKGVLQIGLSWNTIDTDIDLWVTDPFGEKIYYGNPNSASGGYLDRDDTDGFGPENIYWRSNVPDGEYTVQVNYFSGTPATNYEIKVTNGLGFVASFDGTLVDEDQTINVVSFQKTGTTITLLN